VSDLSGVRAEIIMLMAEIAVLSETQKYYLLCQIMIAAAKDEEYSKVLADTIKDVLMRFAPVVEAGRSA
jgi:hypothetical protein